MTVLVPAEGAEGQYHTIQRPESTLAINIERAGEYDHGRLPLDFDE